MAICGGCSGNTSQPKPGELTPDARAIVPADLKLKDVGVDDAGLELTAATLQTGPSGPEWLVAVRNVGQTMVCAVEVATGFSAADGSYVGQADAFVLSPINYRSPSEANIIENCIAPGAAALGSTAEPGSILLPSTLSSVKSVDWAFRGYLIPDVVPEPSVTLGDVDLQGSVVSGAITNGGTTRIGGVTAYAFATNSVGRPTATGTARTSGLDPGQIFNFQVTLTPPVESYQVLFSYQDLM